MTMLKGALWIGAGAVWLPPSFQNSPKPGLVAVVSALIGAGYLTAAVLKRAQSQ